MLAIFGPGVLYGTRTDVTGTTPCNFGKIKDLDLEAAATTKGLTGQNQVAFDFGRGEVKWTAKAKLAAISPLAFMSLFYGVASATGGTLTQYLEAHAVPGMTPFTVMATNTTGFAPLEVLYAATGQPFQQVTSAPAVGQYVNTGAGVLTFAAADAGAAVLVSYAYTSAASGFNLTIMNQLQGFTPTFSVAMYAIKNGKPITYSFPYCASDKLGRNLKENDYTNPQIDFMIGANAAGQVVVESYPELS